MPEDKRLIRKLKRGDSQALRRLYEKYKDELLTIAAAMLNDRDAAEDVLHDVIVSFAAGIKDFTLRSSLRGYLVRCVVNRVRDRFRSRENAAVELESAGHIDAGAKRPEEMVIFGEQSQLLMEALSQTPFEQREVIVLRLRAGMKFKDIAALQGISTGTAQARYRYGLDRIRSMVKGKI